MINPRDILNESRKEALNASRRFRLPFNKQAWKGSQGNWVGMGTGSSIDFQDHRSYQWGDDPRNIHWGAYARTGQLTMKLYRAELSPVIDIVIDASRSMSITPMKECISQALLLFCLENAERAASPVRIHAVSGNSILKLDPNDIKSGQWRQRTDQLPSGNIMPHIPVWGANCMKVLITDTLYPGNPSPVLAQMAQKGGVSIIMAPGLPEESSLDYDGNVFLTDCETGEKRHQHVSRSIAERYRKAYINHFNLWRDACRRYNILFSRIPCQYSLVEALAQEPLKEGMIELC